MQKITASRRSDAKIAKLLGWTKTKAEKVTDPDGHFVGFWAEGVPPNSRTNTRQPIPEYTTDLGATQEVLKEMNRVGIRIEITIFTGNKGLEIFLHDKNGDQFGYAGESISLEICRAFVEWKETNQ